MRKNTYRKEPIEWIPYRTTPGPGDEYRTTPGPGDEFKNGWKQKPAHEVEVGDRVQVFDRRNKRMTSDRVAVCHGARTAGYHFLINRTIRLMPYRRVLSLSAGRWAAPSRLRRNDVLVDSRGEDLLVRRIEKIGEKMTAHEFEVNPYGNVVANGVVVKAKLWKGRRGGNGSSKRRKL